MESYSKSYKDAGVDVTAGYRAVDLMKPHITRTKIPGVLAGIGAFGGLFQPDLSGIQTPVLVSGTDGVGTKLKLAFMMEKHDTIGIDCVAMSANDVACSGAKPLFFLDYIALGKNIPEKVSDIVAGIAEGCVQAGCALVGGETAEMPGLYDEDEYDVAGFCVGLADKDKLIDCERVQEGDILIGLASSGVHSNGFSLIRKMLNISKERLGVYVNDFGRTLGEELLCPTKIYVKAIQTLINTVDIHGISHITGGGFYENIPRMLPEDLHAKIEKAAIPCPPVFEVIANGRVPERDMYNTFNMGVGLCVALAPADVDPALHTLRQIYETAMVIGEVTAGERGITLL